MQRVRRGERVVHGVPVAEVVLHVEAHDPQRRRVGEGPTELLGSRAGTHRVEQRADDLLRDRRRGTASASAGDIVELAEVRRPSAVARPAARSRPAGERRRGRGDDATPRTPPTAARPRSGAPGSAARAAASPSPDMAERLERLVGEVECVALVDEDVIGDRGLHEALDIGERGAGVDRGREHTLGRVLGSRLDEAPVPVREPSRRRASSVRSGSIAKRGARPRVSRLDERERVHEGERLVGGIEPIEHVGHARRAS